MTLASTEFAPPEEIRPHIYRVAVPLPNNPLKSLNSYFICGDEETVIVDVGFNHPLCEAALSAALAALGRSWDGVTILLTHSHPDHTGNLDRIYRPGMDIYANLHSFIEVENFNEIQSSVFAPILEEVITTMHPDLAVQTGQSARKHYVSRELLPLKNHPHVTFLAEGDTFCAGPYTFEVIETPGHDNWHICLYEPTEKLLIVGDHVLNRITPSITTWMTADNALADFLASLEKLRAYDVDLALPGHGNPFADTRGRIDYLQQHHAERLAEIEHLVAAGHDNLIAIASNASWKYANWESWPLDQQYFSMAETMAHLVYLICEGKLKMITCATTHRFETA
ncbi:MAG: MBL fold metallo-hydrolase [Raoultibacter sp.]